MSKKKVLCHKKCCFCGLAEDNEVKYGKIYTYKDIVTHYYCLLLSSNMEQRGRDDEGILGFLADDIHKELRRGKKLVCAYCRKNGATLGCCNTKCKKIFHFPCGVRAGALHQFFGEFKSFCVNHRTTQKVDNSVRQELKNLNEVLCCICYDQVNPENSTLTLWASCCKKAWFHKDCVQQLAISAGYFFKCPLCNNKKDFQQEMLENGIFIPHQDASWELVPHAFQELLYRHDSCDADECLCPKGRNHRSNNAKWELVLCRTCGSQGIHMACGQLKWGNRSVWDCKECRYILSKSKESTSSGVVHIRHNNCDVSSEDSDSDVSVGVEFPTSNNSTEAQRPTVSTIPVKLPPGPKSYKIRQLLSHDFGKSKETYATKCDKSNGVDGEQSQSSIFRSNLLKENYSNCKPNDQVILNIKPSPSSSRSNVITIDSDDEIEEIIQQSKEMNCRNTQARNSLTFTNQDTEQPMLNKTSNSPDIENNRIDDEIIECGSPTPVCNIKITNVTSLSHKLFSKHPDTNLDIIDSGDGYHNELPSCISSNTNSSEAMLKRKSSIFLTSPVGNRFKRVRSDEFNRVSLDLIDSPCSGSQSLPPAFAPESNSPIFEHIYTISRSSKTSKETDVEEVYQEQGSRSGSAIETSYTSENTPFSVISFHNALSNSNISNPFLTSQDDDNNYNENPLEETLCEMNPLIMEDDEVLNRDYPSMMSLENQSSVEAKINDHKFIKKNILDYTTISPINLPEVIELPSTVTENQLLSKDINSSSNCHKDADTSLVAESNNASCNDNASKIIGADESKLYNGSSPDHWGDSSGETSASAWSSDGNDDSFSTVATNYNACDRLRLIPESIGLQDLKFRVCSANVLQMVLYDTFSVNISMEQKTESELYKQPATPMKQYKSEKEFSMGVDNTNRNNCSPYLNDYDDRSSSVDNTDMKYSSRNDIKDDTKENFDPVTATSFKKSATNSIGNNCLSGKDINLFKRVISPLCSYDASEENYDKNWQSTQRFTLPTPDFKLNADDDQSIQRKLRSSSREYCPNIKDSTSTQQDVDERVSPSCFNTTSLTRTPKEKHLSKSVSEQYRRYTNNNIDYETCETVNQLPTRSKEQPVPQDKHLNSLKVSIDLNKIRSVINESILHRTQKRTSLRNGDLKKIFGASEIGLEPESYSSHSSQMSEESDDSKMDVAQSLAPVRSNGHNLRRSNTRNGHKLRRSNRHSEKHCLFDR